MTDEETTPDNPVPAATEKPDKPEKPEESKKPKKSIEPEPRRERSSRGAAKKAAMQISLTSNMKDFDMVQPQENVLNGLKSYRKPKKQPEEILSSSPLKFKAGPKCTKKPLKPGPRSKRGRLFALEEFYLDQKSIDEEPLTAKFDRKLVNEKTVKEKLKAAVIVRDLKLARNPSVKAAYECAQEYYSTIGQFKPMQNLVTVTYQKPKTFDTFQHRANPNR